MDQKREKAMNLCSFSGYLVDNPKLKKINDVSMTEFTLVVYTYRKTKSTGEKSRIPTHLKCEAWHTGAETIHKFAQKGSKIHVHASGKNVSKNDSEVIFRIHEYDFNNPIDNEKAQ